MQTKLNLQPNTPEWLEARKNYRTASEAAIVLGISPFTNREKFKLIKAGLAKQFYSKAMQLGHETEDQIRQWANNHFGKDFKEEIWVNDGYLASLDGIDGDTLIEIKTSSNTYNKIKEGDVPDYYWYQIQQQLYCSPATKAYLVAYCPKTQQYAVSDLIEIDPTAIEAIDDAWVSFDAMPVPEGPVNADDNLDLRILFEKYAEAKRLVDVAQAELDQLKESILTFKAADRNVTCAGYEIVYRKGAKKVDYKTACKGVDLEPFTSYGEPSWSLKMAPSPFAAETEE